MTLIDQKRLDAMWSFTDRLGFAVLATIGFFKGIWTGLAQIPGYVRAEVRSARSRVDDIAKTRETGKSARQRRIDAIKPNQPEK